MKKKILEIIGLFREFGEGESKVYAVDNVSLSMEPGQILGIVGESGSGKSTLARIVMGLDKPTKGNILFENKDIFALTAFNLRRLRANFQMIFQDPYGSLDPRHKVWRIIAEPLHLEENPPKGKALRNRIGTLLEQVGLQPDDMDKYPHEFSGGQRQRIAIARALITKPKLLVADEATSALDLTVQAQILKLILKMRDTYGISVLFITHNIGVVDEICDQVAVMQSGKLIETGPVREVLDNPREPYTQRLLAAEPTLEKIGRKSRGLKKAVS
ncbi:ABC transporter ATP-binding protein [Vibrio salinus]|uniref:ABC transporter ATP-binding protein n=1 Tax=Vibrio salinus TaxID=2899784 RepID=UPI001E5FF649|nr:ABC transporter ATP-binding protein [Vibrio salinus]MCE0492711.1 ABC transporter ATP-binding protein [Vibrio salinus]